jgi:hypothetical protein
MAAGATQTRGSGRATRFDGSGVERCALRVQEALRPSPGGMHP